MDEGHLIEAARDLRQAERARVAVAPPTELIADLTTEQAYRIQELIVEERLRDGEEIVGYKVGLTSQAMQDQLGVDQPDYSPILSSMLLEDGAHIDRADLIQPRVEAEIAFVLRDRLRGPGVTPEDVVGASSHILAAIEVIDSRVEDWRITLPDTVADLASSARVVLGAKAVPAEGVDAAALEVVVSCDGEVIETGVGAAALGSPSIAAAWAVNTLGGLGASFEPGHVIMPGALHRSIPVEGGNEVRAEFELLGSVSVSFFEDRG